MRDALLNLLPWAAMFLTSIDVAYATKASEKPKDSTLYSQCDIVPDYVRPGRRGADFLK